jgi:aldose 1-epimerase
MGRFVTDPPTRRYAYPKGLGAPLTFDRDEDGLARADLLDPDQGTQVSLWVDGSYPYLMLFTGDTLRDVHRRRSLAVEPMTCPPNAFRTEVALIKLDPGSSFTGTWGIIPRHAPARQ